MSDNELKKNWDRVLVCLSHMSMTWEHTFDQMMEKSKGRNLRSQFAIHAIDTVFANMAPFNPNNPFDPVILGRTTLPDRRYLGSIENFKTILPLLDLAILGLIKR